MLNTLIGEIYDIVVTRVEDNGDPELAARAEVDSRRFQIATAWRSVIDGDGRRGRGSACRDIEEFAETQRDKFAEALVTALGFARGSSLSDDVKEEIEDLIDLSMDEAFRDATKAACGLSGFNIVARFQFATELVQPVYEAVLIAFSDDGPVMENGDDERPPGTQERAANGEEEEEDNDSVFTSTFISLRDDPSRCSRQFIVCCLPRFMRSGFCSCLFGSCDARLEEGVWVDASGSTCTCP